MGHPGNRSVVSRKVLGGAGVCLKQEPEPPEDASKLLSSPRNKCCCPFSQPFIRLQPATCQVALVVQVSRGLECPCSSWFLIYYVNENMTTALRQKLQDGYLGCAEWQLVCTGLVEGLPPTGLVSNPTLSHTCSILLRKSVILRLSFLTLKMRLNNIFLSRNWLLLNTSLLPSWFEPVPHFPR